MHGRCARCPAVAFGGIYEGVRERSPLVESEVTGNRIRSLRAFSASENAAEADVASRGVDGLGLSCGGAVAQAVVRGAQVGAALEHPARDVRPGLAGDQAVSR